MRRIKHAHYADKDLNIPPKVVKAFHEVIFEEIVKNPEGVDLPHEWGYLRILAYIPTRDLVDYNMTKKLGRIIKHNNDKTDGYALKISHFTHRNRKRPKHSNGLTYKTHSLAKKAIRTAVKQWYIYDKLQTKL